MGHILIERYGGKRTGWLRSPLAVPLWTPHPGCGVNLRFFKGRSGRHKKRTLFGHGADCAAEGRSV
jgi:hypothetical protein